MTAIETIIRMQTPIARGFFRDLCAFEAVLWACVMAAAALGMNFNDGRYPSLRPAS